MAELLIKGMEIADRPITLVLYPNGDVDHLTEDNRFETIAKAIAIPPHGDLCDKKVLYEKMVENIKIANEEDFGSEKAKEHVTMAFKAVLYALGYEIPTVLEASE